MKSVDGFDMYECYQGKKVVARSASKSYGGLATSPKALVGKPGLLREVKIRHWLVLLRFNLQPTSFCGPESNI